MAYKKVNLNEELYLQVKQMANDKDMSVDAFVSVTMKNRVDPVPDILIDYTDLQQILTDFNESKNIITRVANYAIDTDTLTKTDYDKLAAQHLILTQKLIQSIQDLIKEQTKTRSEIKKYIKKILQKKGDYTDGNNEYQSN